MSKQPSPPPGSVSFWTGSALVWFDGHNLTINRPGGPIKGVFTYAVDQITGILITKPPLKLYVFRVLVGGESAPRRSQGMLDLTRDPFVVQYNSRHKDEAEALAQAVRDAQARLRQSASQQPAPAAASGLGDQLAKLADLHAAGALSDAEFAAAKARLLGQGGTQGRAGQW